MAAAKKRSSASPTAERMRGLFSWMFGSGRTAVVVMLLVALFVGGVWWGWKEFRDRILAAREYRIDPEQVEVTPQPAWIPQSDVRAEVFRSPTLDGRLSLMDDDLTRRIADAFARHPWVAKVGPVTKKYGGVKVDLVYRKPVCMVELPGGGLVPVDVEAVLLPTEAGDITPTEAARYPRLSGVDRVPTGPAGTRWGDARVIGGAEIAAALDGKWEPMRLDHIEPSAADTAASNPSDVGRVAEPVFTLVTHRGTRIVWGYAPGANAVGELSAAEKVARLQHYFEAKDTLDGPEGKAQQLNVRDLPPAVRP
ncbi:MAG: hypothetical protein WCB27_17635 [Thermoguttaceae bacterium]